MSYLINVSRHPDVGGAMNIEENRKTNIDEYLYRDYADVDTRVKVIVYEIFIDIIEKGLNSRNNIKLLFDSDLDILNEIEHEFDQWEIEVEGI
jgi:hypothetical protein